MKLSPYIKKVLIGLQMSNLLVISLMLAGLFTIEQYLAEQWPFGLACDTATIFFHNSFAYSHLISRVRFHMAQNTSQVMLNLLLDIMRKRLRAHRVLFTA